MDENRRGGDVGGMFAAHAGAGAGSTSSDNGDGTFTNPVILFGCAGSGCDPCGGQLLYGQHYHAFVPRHADHEIQGSGKLEIVNYCYDILDDRDELVSPNGKNAYGNGSWAASIRYL